MIRKEHVQPRTRATSAAAVERAGIKTQKLLYTGNIKNMSFVFKHPKYYKELRARNKSDQAISLQASTEAASVRPGPGLKLQAREDIIHEENERLLDRSSKPTSSQAPSDKRPSHKPKV